MPDIPLGLAPGDLGWLLLGATLAGLVRGFAGFGTAMVYLPFAGAVLGPFEALTTLIVKDLVGPLVLVPTALREGETRDVLRLGLGAALALPLGVAVLAAVEPVVFRWSVSVVTLVMLAMLAGGVRYRGPLTSPLVISTGAAGGFLCGSVGLPGPPIIMLYMASTRAPQTVRANLILYLLLADALLFVAFWVSGNLVAGAITLGLLLIPCYAGGNLLGAWAFRPGQERLYRAAAYAIIAASALTGLPVWG